MHHSLHYLAITTENLLLGILGPLFGIFIIWAACSNWSWWWEHRKARLLSSILSKTGARIFYGLIGIALIGGGIAALFSK